MKLLNNYTSEVIVLIVVVWFGLWGQGVRGAEDVRRSVLGLEIVCEQETSASCRLVDTGNGREVLMEGSFSECESGLLDRLNKRYQETNFNLTFWTLGGGQFWADEFIHAGWRIQRNVFTDHHRLLDPEDVRHCWGRFESCRAEFAKIRAREGLTVSSSHGVILLHGLIRSRDSMEPIADHLRNSGYEVINVDYPSTRQSIHEHVDQVKRIIGRLEGIDKLSFVGHSTGGIVIRTLLAESQAGWANNYKLGRVVFIATPHQGASIAEQVSALGPLAYPLGPTLEDLTPDNVKDIPAPDIPFGIITATWDEDQGLNPLLDGPDDGVLRRQETRLAGATDTLTVHQQHSFLLTEPRVQKAVARFLASGNFTNTSREE